MKDYSVLTTSMQSGQIIELQTFATKRLAITYFNDQCEKRNYTNIAETNDAISHIIECGGIGHDFRIELSIIEY
jgi:hypothetical protein